MWPCTGGNLGQIQWIHWKIAMTLEEKIHYLSSKALEKPWKSLISRVKSYLSTLD
jgi:hypothetical protein